MSVLAPLLRPAAWRVAPGAADVPWLRRLGAALMLVSVLALLSWSAAIAHDAWRLQRMAPVTWLAAPVCCVGVFHAWRLFSGWRRREPALTLRWLGPVERDADRDRGGSGLGGWRIDEWGAQPVDVTLVWDWQRLLLLRVRPWRREASAALWVWLHDDPRRPEREMHRLRTLLCLPADLMRPRLMASSPHDPPAASPSMRGVKTPNHRRARTSPRQAHRDAVEHAVPLRVEDDFPVTQLLERWEDVESGASLAPGGRP